MRNRRALLGIVALLVVLFSTSSARAATGPLYDLKATWGPTNLAPGDANASTAEGQFALRIRNIGDEVGSNALVVEDRLPSGVTATAVDWPDPAIEPSACSGVGTSTVKCTLMAELLPLLAPAPGDRGTGLGSVEPTGYLPSLFIDVSTPPDLEVPGGGTNTAILYGGSASLPGGAPCAQEEAQLSVLPPCAEDVDGVTFEHKNPDFGVLPSSFVTDAFSAAYPFGQPSRQASDHPFELRTNFDLTEETAVNPPEPAGDGTRYIAPSAAVRTVELTLPTGFVGNPEAVPKCDAVDFASKGATNNSTACPPDTQVGYLNIDLNDGTENHGAGRPPHWGFFSRIPIYNLKPPKGVLADLGFNSIVLQAHIYSTLDPFRRYAIKTVTPDISSLAQVRGSEVTIWGVPGDPSHDRFRYYSKLQEDGTATGAPFGAGTVRPFLTNPMDCGEDNGGARIRLDSYQHPGDFSPTVEYGDHLNVDGCQDPRFHFEPEVKIQPTSQDAGGPTGLDVDLRVHQQNDEVENADELYAVNGNVKAIATPPMKKVVVTFPRGMTVSPSAAQGLEACSPTEIGIDPATGIPNGGPVRCPDASQFGTLRLKSPALPQDKTIEGRVYVAQPYDNPFGSFLALYLAIEDEDLGLQVKLAGELRLDPETGQITAEFKGLPQLPVSEVEMKVNGGPRAGLVNPQTCGQKTIEATFYSWQDPGTPHTVTSSYDISRNPDGSPCHRSLSERPFDPGFEAGTTNPLAGAFSPLEIDVTRTDADQELSSFASTAPPGLLASLRGVGRCSDAQIAAAANPSRTGTAELERPSCPASAQIGTVDAGAGVGQILTWVNGKVYLAGPYEGAPLSGVAIVPALAGPFDLGVVVTRAPAYLDPRTAQLTLKTTPLPQIFKGVPVRLRDLRVHLNRRGFTLNPTNCEPLSIAATLFSSEGKSKHDSNRFQAADCASLGFRPRLSLRLRGGTRRGGHPALRAVVRPRSGDANFASAAVTLSHSAFLDQSHIRTICTRVQFTAKACPKGAEYGRARVRH